MRTRTHLLLLWVWRGWSRGVVIVVLRGLIAVLGLLVVKLLLLIAVLGRMILVLLGLIAVLLLLIDVLLLIVALAELVLHWQVLHLRYWTWTAI